MSLTDITIRNAKPKVKPYKLPDEKGLYLLVNPTGSKLWRLNYRFAGLHKTLAIGSYPEIPLTKARNKRDEARSLIADEIDPNEVKRVEKQRRDTLAVNTFEAVARDWFDRHLSTKAESTKVKVISRLERFVIPYIGKRSISELTAPDILMLVRRVEKNSSLDTAHRVQQEIGQIIRYAIQTGRAVSDPTPALRGALPPVKQTHFAAPTEEPSKVGEFLRVMDAFTGSTQVAAAIKLLPMLFCRPGELRMMKWMDVDLDTAEWRYIATKTNTPHLVPLPRQAVLILKDLYPLTGHLLGGYVFTGGRSSKRPMSDAAINAAYRRLGIDTRNELTGHGWRAVARTMLHERLGYEPEVIERQLAHAVKDVNGTAYNRTRFIDERNAMMQKWADYLDMLKEGAECQPERSSMAQSLVDSSNAVAAQKAAQAERDAQKAKEIPVVVNNLTGTTPQSSRISMAQSFIDSSNALKRFAKK